MEGEKIHLNENQVKDYTSEKVEDETEAENAKELETIHEEEYDPDKSGAGREGNGVNFTIQHIAWM